MFRVRDTYESAWQNHHATLRSLLASLESLVIRVDTLTKMERKSVGTLRMGSEQTDTGRSTKRKRQKVLSAGRSTPRNTRRCTDTTATTRPDATNHAPTEWTSNMAMMLTQGQADIEKREEELLKKTNECLVLETSSRRTSGWVEEGVELELDDECLVIMVVVCVLQDHRRIMVQQSMLLRLLSRGSSNARWVDRNSWVKERRDELV